MAESIRFPSYDLAPLCTNCSRIFEGPPSIGSIPIFLLASPAIDLIKPKSCCVCSIIWSRYRRLVEAATRLGEPCDLLKVTYSIGRGYISDRQWNDLKLKLD